MIFCLAPHPSLKLNRLNLSRATVALVLFALAFPPRSFAQSVPTNIPDLPVRIRWSEQPGVNRYRIQIARDRLFNDVMFDGVTDALEYVPADLPVGRYYWRVTAADSNQRRSIGSGKFEVKRSVSLPQAASSKTAVDPVIVSGWMAATGETSQLLAAQLRQGDTLDLLGINSAGTVYALDAARGIALWSTPYERVSVHINSGDLVVRPFVPLVFTEMNKTRVIVAFERGLRALDGATGREVWQTELAGTLLGGLLADLDDQPGVELYLTDATQYRLVVLDPATGQFKTEIKLGKKPLGPPVMINTDSIRGLLISMDGNTIEMRKSTGEIVRLLRLSDEITGLPLLADTVRGQLLLVPTTGGLITFTVNSFEPKGRIRPNPADYPLGSVTVADLDSDNRSDTVFVVTSRGRLVAYSIADSKEKWSAQGFTPGVMPVFADLNGDKWRDVFLPGDRIFAIAISGRDGTPIWQSPEPSGNHVSRITNQRLVVIATIGERRIMLVGNDPSGTGLRALELTGDSPASAMKH